MTFQTRREFLGYLGGLAGLAAVAGCGNTGVTNSVLSARFPFEALARRLSGPLLEPGQDGYLARALPWNLRYANVLPAGVAVCQNAIDVREALL